MFPQCRAMFAAGVRDHPRRLVVSAYACLKPVNGPRYVNVDRLRLFTWVLPLCVGPLRTGNDFFPPSGNDRPDSRRPKALRGSADVSGGGGVVYGSGLPIFGFPFP